MAGEEELAVTPSVTPPVTLSVTPPETPSVTPPEKTQHWNDAHSGVFIFIAVLTVVITIVSITTSLSAFLIWVIIAALILISILIAGHGIIGKWNGLLIDDRNRIALSRLQLILWTTLILSAFFASVMFNLNFAYKDNPINTTIIMNAATIAVPNEIWILIGIATTSLVGSPLILSMNKGKTAATTEGDANGVAERPDVIKAHNALKKEGRASSDIDDFVNEQVDGQLIVNSDPKYANLSDMFKGDYTNNAAQLDLGKVQMLYFTVIVLVVYAAALVSMLASTKEIHQFPALSEGMVTLLGISNGGYLLNKTVSATKQK